jgi:hypothetical protein
MSITVRAYTLILVLFLQLFWEAYTSQKPHFFRHPILATKDMRELLSCNKTPAQAFTLT